MAQYVAGASITGVSGLTETFVRERPLPGGVLGPRRVRRRRERHAGRSPSTTPSLFIARFDSGAVGSFEATRFATGRKNAARLEINGSTGSIAFDLEAMNEL